MSTKIFEETIPTSGLFGWATFSTFGLWYLRTEK